MANQAIQSDDSARLQALENELIVVRNELLTLQSARSVRLAKYAKQVFKAKPSEWPELIKQSPAVFKRQAAPSIEHREARTKKSNFSQLYNSQPLYRYPNINVAALGESADELFSFCCNTVSVGSARHRELMEYSAVAIIALSDEINYTEMQKTLIRKDISSGAKLIAITSSSDFISRIKKDFGSQAFIFTKEAGQENSLAPFIDIYGLKHHKVTFDRPKRVVANSHLGSDVLHDFPVELTTDVPSFTFNPNDVLVLELSTETSALTSEYLQAIARGIPTVVCGNVKLVNAPSDLIVTSKRNLAAALDTFNTTYKLEQYSLSCKRDVIYLNNALGVVSGILETIGIQANIDLKPTISIILASKRPEYLTRAINQLEDQTLPIHEVLLNLHGVSDTDHEMAIRLSKKSSLNIKVTRHDESVLFGNVLNAAVDQATGEFITKVDDDDYYGPNHLKDLYVALLYSCADMIGKWNNWVYLTSEERTINWVAENQESYVKHLPGGTLFCKTAMLKNVRFGLVKRAIDSELYRRALARGATLYSTHRYNYVRVRDANHTYKTTDADFKSRAHPEEIDGLDLTRLYC